MRTIRVESIRPLKMDGPHQPYYAVCYAVDHENGALDTFLMQRFAFAPAHNVKFGDFSQLVWEATGTPEEPTLTPSFLGTHGDVRVHLYLKAGKIDLLGDSTVRLA